MTTYLRNYLILILPATLVGSLLSYAGDPTNGLKLGFLSLLGCWLIALSDTKKKLIKFIAIIWWFMFTLHSLVLSSTWLLYQSSIDAYFVIQSLANTSSNETIEFILQNSWFFIAASISSIIIWIVYLIIFSKKFQFTQITHTHTHQQ